MQRRTRKYLFDIQTSISSIYGYLGDTRDFNLYRESKLLRRAVERELEIIGEAANRKREENSGFEKLHHSRL